MPTITIGCRLPHGLTIHHPSDRKITATIAGMNASKVIGSTHMTTQVDADLWAAWRKAYTDYAPLKNGAIFEARGEAEAKDKAKELRKEKTGFEPISPESHGVKKDDGK